MALEAFERAGSVGMSPDGHAYRQAHRYVLVYQVLWATDTSTVRAAPAAAEERRSSRAFPDIVPGGPSPIMCCPTTPALSAR